MSGRSVAELLEGLRAGRRVDLARAISLVEDREPRFEELLHAVHREGFRAARLGVTGPPGAGKSSLVKGLVRAYRAGGETVGVVAVDPSSPFSGGALLGDRIRMNDLGPDDGVFIRSMATRGSLGGLATTTEEVVDVMDAFGFSRVLVETVGVGQTEFDVTSAADTVLVVLVPESGDAVQALKAGLMEIADVFVVNKADRAGAGQVVRDLRQAIRLRREAAEAAEASETSGDSREASTATAVGSWEIPVLETVALEDGGIPEVVEAVEAHRRWLEESGELEIRRRARDRGRIRAVVERELRHRVWKDPRTARALDEGLTSVSRGTATPYSVARGILEAILH